MVMIIFILIIRVPILTTNQKVNLLRHAVPITMVIVLASMLLKSLLLRIPLNRKLSFTFTFILENF